MKDLLKTYHDAAQEIFKRFGLDQAYGEIESKIDVEWTLNGEDSVTWLDVANAIAIARRWDKMSTEQILELFKQEKK